MCDNLDDNKSEQMEKEDNKIKKEKRDNLDYNEKEQLKKLWEKRKRLERTS